MIHLKNLIQKDLWLWVCENSTAEYIDSSQPGAFFVREKATGSHNPSEQEKLDLEFFSDAKKTRSKLKEASALKIETPSSSYLIRPFTDRGDRSRSEEINDTPASNFIFRVLAATSLGIHSKSAIPERLIVEWRKSGALSGDFDDYLPKVDITKLPEEESRYSVDLLGVMAACRVNTNSESGKEWLRESIEQLLICIPDDKHDWIFGEILLAAESRHLQYTYLLMYRVLEFFFPMPGINDLRKETKSKDSHLTLLGRCRNNLGWHWNHSHSARAVTKMATTDRFVKTLSKEGIVNQNSTREEAGLKLVDIRNELAHQGYRENPFSERKLVAATISVVQLCTEAFMEYNTWNIKNPKESKFRQKERTHGRRETGNIENAVQAPTLR